MKFPWFLCQFDCSWLPVIRATESYQLWATPPFKDEYRLIGLMRLTEVNVKVREVSLLGCAKILTVKSYVVVGKNGGFGSISLNSDHNRTTVRFDSLFMGNTFIPRHRPHSRELELYVLKFYVVHTIRRHRPVNFQTQEVKTATDLFQTQHVEYCHILHPHIDQLSKTLFSNVISRRYDGIVLYFSCDDLTTFIHDNDRL